MAFELDQLRLGVNNDGLDLLVAVGVRGVGKVNGGSGTWLMRSYPEVLP